MPRTHRSSSSARAPAAGLNRMPTLDLLLRAEGPIDPYRFAELCLDFEDSDLPFRVDVLDYYRTDPDFLARIAFDCVPLPDEQ